MAELTRDPAQGEDAAEAGGVPWVDAEIQQRIRWRDGDIVVSVPVKSGTTWTMNIVHQLRSGGDPDFDDIYLEVPWIELVPAPGTPRAEIVAKLDAMPAGGRRAFKTHSPAGPLPYQTPGSGADVRYVVVARHPDEAVASLYPFIGSHSDEWFALWDIDKADLVPPDFPTFFEHVAKPMIGDMIFGFVEAWWPLCDRPNVLLMHFSDMKRDLEGSVRRIAEFLDFHPTETQWPAILEYTSFEWMKAHEDKFDGFHVTDTPILNRGAMLRKGRVGAAREDGVTPEISAAIAELGRGVVADAKTLEWLCRGGSVP